MAIKRMLECEDVTVRTATLDDPECGLTEEVLADTDVLVWWGHVRHHLVPDEVAKRVQMHVLSGMGLIVLHSGHKSKPFMRLMGTTCSLTWNEVGERERVFVIDPAHPIAKGLPAYFEVKHEEMYGEHFDVPTPDELVLSAWFQSGQIFRCGCVWRRGYGKVFYFQPGHETYPTYNENEYVRTVIRNAVRYVARPVGLNPRLDCPHVGELERVPDCDRIDHLDKKGAKPMSEEERLDIVEGVDEEGNRLILRVNRYFFYNGEEYVLLSDDIEEPNPNLDEVMFYVMKVTESVDEDGEEIEEFEPVEQELMEQLIEVVKTNFDSDGDILDELSDE